MEKYGLIIQNMVISSSLDAELPLSRLASSLPNVEYNPDQFPGLIYKLKDPKRTALLFNSGKIVFAGGKNEKQIRDGLDTLVKTLKKLGIQVNEKPEIHVQNIVASGFIPFKLNLNTLVLKLENVEYEPEQFPGLVYKLPERNATFLIFSNGKIVCTGLKQLSDMEPAVDDLVQRLNRVLK